MTVHEFRLQILTGNLFRSTATDMSVFTRTARFHCLCIGHTTALSMAAIIMETMTSTGRTRWLGRRAVILVDVLSPYLQLIKLIKRKL